MYTYLLVSNVLIQLRRTALWLVQARNGNLKIGSGLYVASAGFSFDAAGIREHTIITRVGTTRTTSLQNFQEAMAAVADGTTVVVHFYNIGDRHNVQVVSVRVNHRWFPMKQWHRNDITGLWDSSNFRDNFGSNSLSQEKALPAKKSDQEVNFKLLKVPEIAAPVGFTLNLSPAANRVIPSLCKVTFNVLHAIDGVHEWHFTGCGLVVCAQRGLVLVDRNTITIGLGEVTVSFATSVEVPARVVFMHPFHNFALVQYDPRNFEPGTIQSAIFGGDSHDDDAIGLKPGDSLEFVGLCRSNTDTCMSQSVRVSEISCVAIPQAHTPRFRAVNEDIVKFEEVLRKCMPCLSNVSLLLGCLQVLSDASLYLFVCSWPLCQSICSLIFIPDRIRLTIAISFYTGHLEKYWWGLY